MSGHVYMLPSLLVALAMASAACVAREPRGEQLSVQAEWQPWMDMAHPHLMVHVSNLGDEVAHIGPGGHAMRISGPGGMVPMDWGAEDFARTIHPGQGVTIPLHPHAGPDGMSMAMDHAGGTLMMPRHGEYVVCVGDVCSRAVLGG